MATRNYDIAHAWAHRRTFPVRSARIGNGNLWYDQNTHIAYSYSETQGFITADNTAVLNANHTTSSTTNRHQSLLRNAASSAIYVPSGDYVEAFARWYNDDLGDDVLVLLLTKIRDVVINRDKKITGRISKKNHQEHYRRIVMFTDALAWLNDRLDDASKRIYLQLPGRAAYEAYVTKLGEIKQVDMTKAIDNWRTGKRRTINLPAVICRPHKSGGLETSKSVILPPETVRALDIMVRRGDKTQEIVEATVDSSVGQFKGNYNPIQGTLRFSCHLVERSEIDYIRQHYGIPT